MVSRRNFLSGAGAITAAVGGLRTLVEHGRTGVLVEQRDPAAFAAASISSVVAFSRP